MNCFIIYLNKHMVIIRFLHFSLISFFLILISCNREKEITNQDNLLGTWISIDSKDTLYFRDKTNFYKSNGFMQYDHYDYQVDNDSLKIGYSGKLYILVLPTKHKFQLNENELIIDFRSKYCFGFDLQLMKYIKKGE
jgi:hypothetical protein